MAFAEKTWLFILRANNDIDHITPVIWKALKSGKRVRAVFVDKNSNIEIACDARLRFLQEAGCPVEYHYAIGKPKRSRLRVSPVNPLAIKFQRIADGLRLRFLWTGRWAERLLKEMNASVVSVDSHAPSDFEIEGRLVLAAKRLGIPVVCLSHGPNVYTSFYPEDRGSRPLRHVKIYEPGYDLFDTIAAQAPPEASMWRKQGLSKSVRVAALGSPRFCPEWMAVNQALLDPFVPAKGHEGKLKVVFYMPHWGPSVDREKTLEAVERLAADPWIYLVVKEHTREGAGNLPETFRAKYAEQVNTEVIQSARSVSFASWVRSGFRAGELIREADSAALARWADVTVAFGSSVGLEPLCLGKLLIDPLYLYQHATMYQAMGAGLAVTNHDELNHAVRQAKPGAPLPYSTAKLERVIVYGEREPHDVLATYVELLDGLARGAKPSAEMEAVAR